MKRAQRIGRMGDWEWDVETNVIRWSDECARIVGLEYGGKVVLPLFFKHVHPDDRPKIERAIKATLENGAPFCIDFRMLCVDGREIIVHEEADLERDAEGKPKALVGTMQDVTNLKRVEQQLLRSQESLARAQRVGHVGHWEWDARTDLTTWSEECYRIFGITPREGPEPRSTLAGVVPPEELSVIRECFAAALQHKTPFQLEHLVLRPDGEVRTVCVEAEVTRDEVGRVIGMLGVVHDITERHRLAREREELIRELADERSWLRAVFERAPIGLMMHRTADPPSVTVNPAGEALTGQRVQDGDALAQALARISRPDGSPVPELEIPLVRAQRFGEDVVGYELVIEKPDGTRTNLISSAHPVFDASGNILGAVTTSVDITAHKELERMREEWTSIVAHDLKQPLTTILATASFLSRRAEDPALKHKVDRIEAAAQRLIRLVSDLSDLSRLSAQRLQLVTSDTDVAALITRTIDNLPDEHTRAQISFTVRDAIPSLRVDQQRIEQVLENLLSNAVKYGAPATQIRIALERLPAEIMVRVTNAGDGIPADLAPRLFERFQRANRSAQRIQGTGLGLYICRGLIEAHGGRIGVESVPGQTTTFWFTLPIPL